MERGYNSMPIHLPGTKYYESMKVLRCSRSVDILYTHTHILQWIRSGGDFRCC
jgi:hypothetical protein